MAPLYTRGPAGARNFVRRATRRLVERFYINLWTKDMSKLDALREAQLWLLKRPDEIRSISLAGDESRAHMFGLGGTPVEWRCQTAVGCVEGENGDGIKAKPDISPDFLALRGYKCCNNIRSGSNKFPLGTPLHTPIPLAKLCCVLARPYCECFHKSS
jgi:hypothetical protein